MDRVVDLPHTADIGFQVEASGPDRLFELAAEGLVRALDFPSGPDHLAPEGRTERVLLARPDLDRLLVAWLRELLHRATRDRLRPDSVRVSLDRAPDGAASLEAEVRWREWSEETAPAREIKGVTYHGLRVAERDGAWHADVFLDV